MSRYGSSKPDVPACNLSLYYKNKLRLCSDEASTKWLRFYIKYTFIGLSDRQLMLIVFDGVVNVF